MKSGNLTQSSLRNDPINRRMQGFSFRIFEDESGVQDVISSFSLDQSLNSSVQWKRKWVTNTGKQTAHDLVEYTRSNWRLIANRSSIAKNVFYKDEINRGLSDEASYQINDHDRTRFNRNDALCDERRIAIVWLRFDRRSIAIDGCDAFTYSSFYARVWLLMRWTSCPPHRRHRVDRDWSNAPD